MIRAVNMEPTDLLNDEMNDSLQPSAISDRIVPHSRPFLGDDVSMAALQVSKTAFIGPGQLVKQFEHKFAAMHGATGAVATNSGTAALHLSLLALGIRHGDEVITPAYVCTAILNAIQYVGATAVLADCSEDSFNVEFSDVKAKLTRKTRAVIVPHMFGEPANVHAIKHLGVPVIEDCAQSLGADLNDNGELVGCVGDLAVFSFHATKMITTGGGGMVVTRDVQLLAKLQDLSEYDSRDDYIPRYNYQMNDLAAGIGLRQLQRLPEFISRRRALAARLKAGLQGAAVEHPQQSPGGVYYRYVVKTMNLESLQNRLIRDGIHARRPVYKPLHHYLGGQVDHCDRIYKSALSIPLYPAMTEVDVERIITSSAWD